MRMRLVLATLGLLVAAPGAGAEVGGFSLEGSMPGAVSAPGTVTVVFAVTAPAGGNSTTFRLARQSTPIVAPAFKRPKGWRGADDGTGGTRVPTLAIGALRLVGPGTLTSGPVTTEMNSRGGCVRDGELNWGSLGLYRLDLPAGQTTKVLVDVTVPRGLASRTPVLELTPTAWQATAPDANNDASWPVGLSLGPIAATVPRTTGVWDELTLERLPGVRGTQNLSGVVRPARAGQRVEIVGRAARTDADTSAYFTLDNIIRNTITGQRVLAKAKTDANGRWSARVKLSSPTVLVARTTHGLRGTSTRGASCPLVLG